MPKESRTAHLDQIDSHSNSDLSDHELSTFSSMKEEDGDTPASMGSQTDSASQLSFPLVNTRRPATPIPGQRSIFDSSALRSISSDSSPTSEGTAPLLSAQQLLVQVDEWITYLNTHQSLWLERRSNNHATSNGGTETPDIERGLVWTGKVKAVLVGINYVSWDSNQLGGCYHDTETMRELLQNSGLPHPPDIKHITDVDPNATQPTRETILSAFEQLITNSEAGDVLVFHYSGHGARVPDHNNSESDGQDDAWVPPQYKPLGNEALIIDDELHVLVEKLPWNRFLLVISDSCHSGTMLDLGKKITNPNHGPVIGIGGCRDPETSSDTLMNGSRCGVMTNALLRIIEQAGGFVPFVRDYLTRVSGRAEVERSLRALIKSHSLK
ncbi:MAG: caspase family protein [Pseudomonadota bacterium]